MDNKDQFRKDFLSKTIEQFALGFVYCVEAGSTLAQAISIMQENKIGSILITSGKDIVGIFTETDVLQKIAGAPIDLDQEIVDKFMTPNPRTLKVNDKAAEVIYQMYHYRFRHVPVIDQYGEPLSLVSVNDVLAFIVEHIGIDEDCLSIQSSEGAKSSVDQNKGDDEPPPFDIKNLK